jgi:hypothetical protein
VNAAPILGDDEFRNRHLTPASAAPATGVSLQDDIRDGRADGEVAGPTEGGMEDVHDGAPEANVMRSELIGLK